MFSTADSSDGDENHEQDKFQPHDEGGDDGDGSSSRNPTLHPVGYYNFIFVNISTIT